MDGVGVMAGVTIAGGDDQLFINSSILQIRSTIFGSTVMDVTLRVNFLCEGEGEICAWGLGMKFV